MSIHRTAAKRDKNESEIVTALRHIGALVAPISGKGVPDLIVAFRSQVYLLEVKARKGKLTADQIAFHSEWSEVICVVRTVDEALRAIGAID